MERRKYEVADKRFWQGSLSCGQTEHLIQVLPMKSELLQISPESVQGIMKGLGKSLYVAMAVCLVPDGEGMGEFLDRLDRPGEIDKQAKFFRANMTLAVAADVVRDFFGFNPLSWLLTQLAESVKVEGTISQA